MTVKPRARACVIYRVLNTLNVLLVGAAAPSSAAIVGTNLGIGTNADANIGQFLPTTYCLLPTQVFRAGKSHPAQTAGPWLALAPSLAFHPSTGRASCPPLLASAWAHYRNPPAAAAIACGSAMADPVGRVMRVAVSAVIGLAHPGPDWSGHPAPPRLVAPPK